MSMLSIPSYKTDDPNYRYKMPRLLAKVEGRGNGIRTNIVNMGDIARALKRPPDYPTKFCGHELGAQSKFDPAEGKAIVNGAHEQRDLQMLIDKFIDKFVLCENCRLPEIDLLVKKNRVDYTCNACGKQGQVDNRHKLATFILKNPPGESTLGAKKKKTKEERQQERVIKTKLKVSSDINGAACGDKQDDLNEDDKTKKVKKSKKEKKDKKDKEEKKLEGKDSEEHTNTQYGDNEYDENGRKDDQATNKSASNIGTGSGSSTGSDCICEDDDNYFKKKSKKNWKSNPNNIQQNELHYDSPEIIDVTQRMLDFISASTIPVNNLDKNQKDDNTTHSQSYNNVSQESPSLFFERLRILQVSQDFNHCVKLFVTLEVLFTVMPDKFTIQGLDTKMNYLRYVTHGMTDKDILKAFEDFIVMRPAISGPSGFKMYPYVLQKLYNADIIDEDGILKHYSNKKEVATGREGYLKAAQAAKPFIDWLQQSSADNDSEEDEEEQPQPQTLSNQAPTAAVSCSSINIHSNLVVDCTNKKIDNVKVEDAPIVEDDEECEDFNIDDI